jgi:PAS domain S-box-containing protein
MRGKMRALKISLVGFSAEEQPVLKRLFSEICPDAWLNCLPTYAIESSRLLQDYDIVLLRYAEESVWVKHFLQSRVVGHIYQPVLVIVEQFTSGIVVELTNLGADRVIPFHEAWELVPACMQVFFPEVCKGSTQQACEKPPQNAFDGMSGITRLLRTEKLGLTFVERLLDILDAMVVVLSKDGGILFFNRKCEELTGYGLPEVAGRNFADIFLLPEEKAEVMQVLSNLKEGSFPGQHQNSWLTREGKEIRIEWSNTSLIDENGEVAYILAIGLDITEAYTQSQSLRALEQRFAKVFNTTLIGIAILTRPDGRVIQANEGLANILGVPESDLTGKTLVEISLFSSHLAVQEAIERVTMQSLPVYLEVPLLTGDHRHRTIQLSLDMFDLAGQAGLLLLAHDITERVQAEERYFRLNMDLENRVLSAVAEQDAINRELHNEISYRQAIESSSERLTQIIWETPDIVAITNIGGHLIYLNNHGRKLIGLEEMDSISQYSVYEFYDPEYRKYILDEIMPYVVMNGSWRGETTLIFADGRKIPISQVILGHRDENGEVKYFSSIARDISEQKEYEQKLQQSYEREKRLGEMRSSLFSMTSHQFRTPLSTILSSADLLDVYGEQWGKEKRSKHIKRIQEAVGRMEKLLSGILLLRKMESQVQVDVSEIELVSFCQRFVEEVYLNEQGLHKIEFDAAVSPLKARVDGEILRRILDNILSNALKYSPPGSRVRFALWLEAGVVHVEVSDQGIGIPEKEMPLLFAPFYRGTNVTDKPGSGLGLMIVEKSLELIQGSIEIFSKTDQGTVVLIRFPQGEMPLGLQDIGH